LSFSLNVDHDFCGAELVSFIALDKVVSIVSKDYDDGNQFKVFEVVKLFFVIASMIRMDVQTSKPLLQFMFIRFYY
jgi:hypothetical protein